MSHVTDCYVAVVETTTNTYKYYQPIKESYLKRKTKHQMTTQCWNERDSSHVVTTVIDILLFI